MIERRTGFFLAGTCLFLAAWGTAPRNDADLFGSTAKRQSDEPLPPREGPSPRQLFEERIMPIFRSPNPSSCTQCHLANIDLKDYILPSHEKTFLSLRDQGLIDLDKPAESKILKLIQRGAHDDNPSAALIHETVRQAEYQAFAAWIVASCLDPKLRNAPRLTAEEASEEKEQFVALVQNTAQTNKLLAAFLQTIWARQKSCSSCHMPGGPQNAKFVAKFGARVNWMSPAGPAATMQYLTANKLLDPDKPDRSLLLLKGTNEVEHGGGKKMVKGDACYKDFLAFAQAYADSTKAAAVADNTKPPPDKTTPVKPNPAPAPAPDARKFIELSVEGLKNVDDNFKLRSALTQVAGVKAVIIDRKTSGPSSVRVQYADKEPDVTALLQAVAKSGFKGTKVEPSGQ